ncbi:hypothetical protein [Sphingomonas montana]|uniref:hypothetical protein n=1 Tax=Sphingomonas montana TaxID=1843236 RepID=UPI00096DB7B5|nr:hypothetical protein [Sphingomonas montana]
MTPDLKSLLDSLLDYETDYQQPLADLMRVAGEQLKLIGCALAQGRHPKYSIKDSEDATSAAAASFQGLSAEDRQAVTRLFLQVCFYGLVTSWGDDTLEHVKVDNQDSEASRRSVAAWLELLQPAILSANIDRHKDGLTVRDVSNGLAALDAGELPDLFKPSKRKGRERNSYTLAKLRLEIVELYSGLLKAGMPRREAEKLANEASARAPADTRRKWKAAAERNLTATEFNKVVFEVAAFASKNSKDGIAAELHAVGARYNKAFLGG